MLASVGWAHRWTTDDGFIYFRIVHNVLHGAGPTFNPGERVEAYTRSLRISSDIGMLQVAMQYMAETPMRWWQFHIDEGRFLHRYTWDTFKSMLLFEFETE